MTMALTNRKEIFIVSTASHFCGVIGENLLKPDDQNVLNRFVNVDSCRTLYAQSELINNSCHLKLTSEPNTSNKTLVFFKLKSAVVTDDNFHELIQVASTIGNPGSTFIEALRQVWAPALQSSGLSASTLKKLEKDILGKELKSTSLADEEAFWKGRTKDVTRKEDKKVIAQASKIIKDIRSELKNAASDDYGLSGMEEVVEVIAGHVDDLWKLDGPLYNEEKMGTLLEIIGDEVVSLVQSLLNEAAESNDFRIKDDAVTNAAIACEKWVNVCQRLTSLFWPHQSLHPWTGSTFIPSKCSNVGKRIRQTSEIRLQYRQITRLLSDTERSTLGTQKLLDSFNDFQIISSENDKIMEWEGVKHRLDEKLIPAEQRITEKLKKQLANAGNATVLVGEFIKYAELFKREYIRQTLRSEREALMISLDDLIENYQSETDIENLLDMPQILKKIQAARSAEIKLETLLNLAKGLLNDLPGYKEAIEKISAACKMAETQRHDLVETWINETKSAIKKKELSLSTDSAVVELVGKSMMKVNYDPRLAALVKEARALSGQGIELPRDIRDLVEQAGTLGGRARVLQQIANFHNTIGDRMIPSQRPLMLSTALELARAVQDQSGVVWSDLHAVDAYINRLREFVGKFARQNSELAAKHVQLRDLVVNLLKDEVVNLIGNQIVWKDTLRVMRTIVDEVEAIYGNTKAWKLHWDRQLLKVLGVAYRATLPNLVRKLPDIRVELIYRDNSLQWRPPMEEIRAKLYSGIRRFLVIPMNFRGVGDPSIGKFGILVQKSAYLFGGVYREAEMAFITLNSVKSKWLPLAIPENVQTGEQLRGKSPEEWEKAFKDAKKWAQDIGKLRGNEMKIYCFTIDTLTTRNDIESATRRHWDRLSSDLRSEATSRLVLVVEFLSSAARELDRRPKNVEEVAQAYETHTKIIEESEAIEKELDAVTGLARVLAAWTREKIDGIFGAHAAWEGLSDRLERHKTLIARQLDEAKVNIRHRAEALQDECERWETRWFSKPETITLDWLLSMRERWTSLQEQKDLLIMDCQRVNLDINSIIKEEPEKSKLLEASLEAEESNIRFQDEFLKELANQEAEEWVVARKRLPRFHDWLDSWEKRLNIQLKESADDKGPEKKSNPDLTSNRINIDTFIEKKIREIKSAVELAHLLRGDELAEEHWNELRRILKLDVPMKDLTLGHILKCASKIDGDFEVVKDIVKKALAESGIRQAIIDLESWESSTSLKLREFENSKSNKILLMNDYNDILVRLGELKLLLEGSKGAAGYERFASRVSRCELTLFEFEERIKMLGNLQRKWIYLEPVYSSGAVPNDSSKWIKADKEFRYLMSQVAQDPRISSLRTLPMPAMLNLKDLLDRCQRSLDEFLEEKRLAYPRLYFLSDEDLLELISGSLPSLNNHLPKLFHGISSTEQENRHLSSVVSAEGEILTLPSSIDLSEPLPTWLNNLEDAIRLALRQSLEKCLSVTNPDVSAYPAQILLLCERIHFTEKCEEAIRGGILRLKGLVEVLESQRAKFRSLETSKDFLTSQKARSLLLETVHHLDIVRNLINVMNNNRAITWLWNKNLRCYRSSQGPIVKCAGAEFPYRFEYQGAAVGLVRTPLTERCFLALTQAMKLGLGASPTGPAGTGKTESVKALAGILGRLVLVFNCDEGMDTASIRRILGGLAQAGAWGCFDEFNRLEEKTLSAVSMLVRPLQEALRDDLTHVRFGDQPVKLDPHCCIFITMNPAGTDYGGRHKLPDSLARLFRPIGMAHPNKTNIAKALLECGGFLEASTLSQKLVEVLDVSEKLLSQQPHYDWGLRALRAILDAVPSSNSQIEAEKLMDAIKASTVPKLTDTDTTKFLNLLQDIFPSVNLARDSQDSTHKEALTQILEEICEAKGLQRDVIMRCHQLNDQLRSRTGVAIVGPPGSGKSLIRKVLFEALNKTGEPLKQIVIFPGVITKAKLLGQIVPQTREWKDGILSTAITSASDSALWIVLDGDVEPEWVESLNSALDDNRLLTLASGVAVKLGSRHRFIFETHKLSQASPATVSRLGVVHLAMTPASCLLSPSVADSLSSVSKSVATSHLASIISAALEYLSLTSSSSNLFFSSICHLRRALTQNMATYSLVVSIGLQLKDPSAQESVAKLIYQLTDSWCPNPKKPLDILYNSELDRLEPFSDSMTSMQTEGSPILLTNALERGLATILPWIEGGQATIIRGEPASGKSTLISIILSSMKENIDLTNTVYASALYGPEDLIRRLKKSCVRLESSANGRTYLPKSGSKVILVLEDLHTASKSLQELVRSLLQEGGFYEDDLEFANLPVMLLASGDVSTVLHPRLNALLAAHYLAAPSQTVILEVVRVHLEQALNNRQGLSASDISNLATAMQESMSAISSNRESDFSYTTTDLSIWARTLECYPDSGDPEKVAKYLLDCGKRLFHARMTLKDRNRWCATLTSRSPVANKSSNDIYIWKKGSSKLMLVADEDWRRDIEAIALKCARESEPVEAALTSTLLKRVADLSWAFGCGQRGILLLGRPGAGRKSSTRLAASYAGLKIVDSGPGRGKSSIKLAIQAAGIEGEHTLLLLEEHHMREEGLSKLIETIVAKGEVPGLMSPEEFDGLIAPLMDLVRKEDLNGGLDEFFYHRVHKFLRVIVLVDSLDVKKNGPMYFRLLQQCIRVSDPPGNEWWSLESSLMDVIKCKSSADDITKDVEGFNALIQSHLHASHRQQAPARFLALLSTWQELKNQWAQEIASKLSILDAGIGRLREAGEKVAKLEDEASKQREELEAEKRRANAALEQITATMRGATGQRGEMSTLKVNTERESVELARRKLDIEVELGKVEPLVAAAAQAVAGIGADALAEVRSLRAPPAAVRDVLEGVLRLMGIKDTSWNSMKTFLAKRGIKDEIRTWDARRSSPASLEAVAKLIKDRPESFEEKTARRASVAAAPLAAWVLANLQYGEILQQVAPLEREQRLLAEKLSAAEAQIGKLAAGLSSVESKVEQLQVQLAEHSRGAAALQLRSEATEASLVTARTLLEKLDVEHNDWQSQLESLNERKVRLNIEAAMAASLFVYEDLSNNDKKQKSTIGLLVTDRERLLWRAQNLPADTDSLAGAVCALRGPLVPLFIDPTGVAVAWLKSHLNNRLEVTNPDASRFLITLELAVRFGKPLLVEEIVQMPAVLLPLLRKKPLRLGDRVLPAQPGFKLFLATRKDNFEEVASEIESVLFKITLGTSSSSLTERFIEKALLHDIPELEQQRREALELEERLSGERDSARLDLLTQLGAARGQDLLEESQPEKNSTLLTTLEATQTKAKEIIAALDNSRLNREKVSKRSKLHERVAKFTTRLFKITKAFTSLNPMYVFSAEIFADLYLEAESTRKSLGKSDVTEQDGLIENKLLSLTLDLCTKAAYRKHRLTLALYFALCLSPVPEVERSLLVNKTSHSKVDSKIIIPDWIPAERHSAVRNLAVALPNITERLQDNSILDPKNIYKDQTLTSFQKILAMQAFRPDHLHTALTKFAIEQLGVRDLAPSSWTLKSVAENSGNYPLLLLLSPGADPGPELAALASQLKLPEGFTEVSLGQGQAEQAENALERACRNGGWVLLSNLQLALNWLPRLDSLLRSSMCSTEKNSLTKIWLATEECQQFYPGLAEVCFKIAYEPPEGVKRNLNRSLAQLQQAHPQSKNSEGLVVLSWLHAVLQERRKFVPYGWIRAYEWSDADLDAARKLVVTDALKFNPEARLDWEEGQGLLDVVIYGGRLQDQFDMAALNAMLRKIWCQEVFQGQQKLGGVISVPEASRNDITKLINRLPDSDAPLDVFSLPANALRAWERSAAESVLSALKKMLTKSSDRTEPRSKKIDPQLQHDLKNVLERHRSILKTNSSSQAPQSPVEHFYDDEIRSSMELIATINSDVKTLRIYNSKTPDHWIKEWPSGPQEVEPFIKALLSKNQYLLSLKSHQTAQAVNLAWFTRPRTFLTTLKQYTARALNFPVEGLELQAHWVEDIGDDKAQKPTPSILINGLLLSGAEIKNGSLRELDADSAPVVVAPSCRLNFVPGEAPANHLSNVTPGEILNIPIYSDSQRSRLIWALPVGCVKKEQDKWLRRGVIFYLGSN